MISGLLGAHNQRRLIEIPTLPRKDADGAFSEFTFYYVGSITHVLGPEGGRVLNLNIGPKQCLQTNMRGIAVERLGEADLKFSFTPGAPGTLQTREPGDYVLVVDPSPTYERDEQYDPFRSHR